MSAQISVSVDPGQLKKSSWSEFGIRVVFGGAIAVVAYLVGQRFGPSVAGLFLAFPAIMPASVTLVEKHDGKGKAVSDARGTMAGTVGLLVFGAAVWQLSTRLAAWQVLALAAVAWLLAALACWLLLEWLMAETHDTEPD
jgi:uncharacterized membrane protein (GlpM family)